MLWGGIPSSVPCPAIVSRASNDEHRPDLSGRHNSRDFCRRFIKASQNKTTSSAMIRTVVDLHFWRSRCITIVAWCKLFAATPTWAYFLLDAAITPRSTFFRCSDKFYCMPHESWKRKQAVNLLVSNNLITNRVDTDWLETNGCSTGNAHRTRGLVDFFDHVWANSAFLNEYKSQRDILNDNHATLLVKKNE